MNKQLVTKDELKPKIISGLTAVADIVKQTLGPGGLPIILDRVGQALNGEPLDPKITKDGVSVANDCASLDPVENLIIRTVINICKKTNTLAGDGTTTAIVLGEAIVKETLKVLNDNPELNPQLVRESIEQESKKIIEQLKEMATPVNDYEKIKEVATISANGELAIGEVLGEAFKAVGAEGVVTVDEGHSNDITLEIVEGYQINRGAEARDRFFNTKENTRFEVENAAILIYDGKLFNYTHLMSALKTLAGVDPNTGQATKQLPPVVILANEFSSEVIQFLLIQKAEMGMQFCCVKGPHMTHVRSGYYDDIAVLTGGSRLGNGNKSLINFESGDEGLVKRVVIDKYKCTFYEGQGLKDDILNRVKQLKLLKKEAESPYDSQVISDRIAALTNGVAKIGVGGATEFEIKEKYDRIEDALNAARAAIEEGVVPGGGVTLLRISNKLSEDKSVGSQILAKALRTPFSQILSNIGLDDGQVKELIYKVLENDAYVYDARNKKIVNAFKAGIIDPVKVTRIALENAVSIASLLSTAGGGIVFVKNNQG